MAKRTSLVQQHLERVSGKLLEEHQDVIRDYVRGQSGIYALYKNERMYYCGLASNLSARLKAHLKDRHAGKWNRFSIYLTGTNTHLRELEALVIRTMRPAGNRQMGRLAGSTNLERVLRQHLRDKARKSEDELFGRRRRRPSAEPAPGDRHAELLRAAFPRGKALRAWYQGYEHRARLLPDGRVRYGSRVYESASAAGRAVRRRATNGWRLWHFRDPGGEWVPLATIKG